MPPSRALRLGHAGLDRVHAGHVQGKGEGSLADPLRRLFRGRDLDVGDADARALARITFGDGGPDTTGTAGHDRSLAVEPHQRRALPLSSNL